MICISYVLCKWAGNAGHTSRFTLVRPRVIAAYEAEVAPSDGRASLLAPSSWDYHLKTIAVKPATRFG